jgi:hypothetical protein
MLQPVGPIPRARLAPQEDRVRDIGWLVKGRAFEQRWAHDQGVGFRQEGYRLILRPSAWVSRSSPNGYMETTAQLVMKSRCGRHGYFNLRSRGMKVLKTWDQPTKSKGGRGADV